MDSKHRKLINNTIMLYLLTFSNYFFNFITIPFQTRILGPEYFAKLSFAAAFVTYFQLFFDFGFILSATEDVAQNRADCKKLNQIFTEVMVAKILLIGISLFVLIGFIVNIQAFRADATLLILYFIGYALNSLFPDFLYRGLQIMTSITIRSIAIKGIFCSLVFIFLRKPEQYYYIPLFNIIGSIIALFFVYKHVRIKLHIKMVPVKATSIWQQIQKSSTFFLSRIATTAYTTTNTFVMGMIYGSGSSLLGYYSSAEKLLNVGKQGINPIVDSLYPHMVENKDYRFLKKILKIFVPIIVVGTIMVDFFAVSICNLILGMEFIDSAYYLRLMSPVVLISFLGMIFGFPVLSPLGLAKYANLSVIFSSAIHIVGLVTLYIGGWLTLTSVCMLTLFTETNILIIRLIVFIRYKYRREH